MTNASAGRFAAEREIIECSGRNRRAAARRAPVSSLRPLHISAGLIGDFLFRRMNRADAAPQARRLLARLPRRH
ncbi:hypothetical protein ACT2E5_24480 [Burkholderia vietnamiensis]|uniref:hypothetical protein n=1 Tax=Burkholderia vietnamiensis TaxID=60552 RepID=UPI001404CD24|nr:hypothetical protein [Burkholderia vietnamiensis]HDR8919988.1 hypothetical protein [Burkholderia vietnamiensis]HDR8978219.1 hypothetical protein [Burkholderia vietnamiensis]HDR9066780.1 hypothetical protein [Burkholderia vietnamiensis]